MGLKNKAVHSLGWSFVDNIVNQGLRFLIGLVLARLVTPHEYGLVGLALIFVTLFESLVDGGFSSALIQKKDAREEDYSTAFFINLLVSTLLYVTIFLLSPFFSSFFNNEEEVLPLVRVLALLLVIDAFMLVPKARLTKNLELKILTKISCLASLVAGVVGIIMAFMGYGAWALVGQMLTRHGCNSFCILAVSEKSPLGKWSKESFNSLFSFGSKLLISDIINSIYNQLYRIVIGKFYSASTLGQFTRAMQFSELFSVMLSQVIQKVSFPSFAKVQNEEERMVRAVRLLVRYTSFMDLTCMLSLAAISKSMVLVLIGEKWLESIPYLQLLCLNMLFLPLHGINTDIIKAKGRSDIFLKLEIVKKCLLVLPVLTGIFYNIYWMLIVNIVVEFLCFFLNSYFSSRLIEYSVMEQIKDIIPSLRMASIVAALLYALSLLEVSEFVLFPLQLIIGICLVILTSELFKFDVYLEMKTAVVNYIRTRRW